MCECAHTANMARMTLATRPTGCVAMGNDARHPRRRASLGCAVIAMGMLMVLCASAQTAFGQIGQNSPPVMYIDRDWKLSEDEANGTVVARVQAHDDNGDSLVFGLEPNQVFRGPTPSLDRLPFRINERTGVVHLNDSLAGRGGEVFSIYVTVSDGIVELKNEVYVHVRGRDENLALPAAGKGTAFGPGSFKPHVRNITDLFPAFGKLPGVTGTSFGGQMPPGRIGGGGHRQTHTYPGASRPINTKPDEGLPLWSLGSYETSSPPPKPMSSDDMTVSNPSIESYDGLESYGPEEYGASGQPDKAPPQQVYTYQPSAGHKHGVATGPLATSTSASDDRPATSTAAPMPNGTAVADDGTPVGYMTTVGLNLTSLLSLCGLLLALVSIGTAYICRHWLCAVGRRLKTKSKAEMAKKSTASGVASVSGSPMGATLSSGGGSLATASSSLTDADSRNSMVMQNWSGPRAFSNRYVPWERDGSNQHAQISSQLSSSSTSTMAILKSDRWEFPRHRLKFFNVLGQGAFGLVWRCEASEMNGHDGISVVAVKTLKENASDIEIKDLNSELQVMKTLEPHVNVVRLLGCCTEKEPIFVILEYVNRGKLQDYLRNSRAEKHYGNADGQSNTLTSGDLTSFMYQVARGMEYLSSRGIIHRDLAARNILITDDHTCKVADFGFARDVITSKVYERKSEGKLPIRWMAIESIYDNLFSVKSDIWSFGILMWEIVTLGSTPYPGISASDVMRKVRDGYRLEKPEHCRRELYNIMYYCWARDFNDRPLFGELVELLDKLLVTEMDYIELERFPDHNYYNMSSLSGEKL